MSTQTVFTSGIAQDQITAGPIVDVCGRIGIQATSAALGNEEFYGPVLNSVLVINNAFVVAVAGSTSTAVQLGKVSGSNILGSAIPLTTGVVVVSGSDWVTSSPLIASTALQILQPGDRLCAIKTGVWQPPTAVLWFIQLQRI